MSKNKHVLFLVENLSVPADPRVWKEARTLRQHGYQVSIICPQGEERDQEPYAYLDGVHIYRYPLAIPINTSTDYIKEYAIALFHTFRLSLTVWYRHGFDIIHAANPPDLFFIPGLFYRLFGKKFVFDQHDLAPEMFQIKFATHKNTAFQLLHGLLQAFEFCSYHVAHMVITTNESQKQNAIKRGRCRADKIFVVRNGPDQALATQMSAEPALKKGRKYLLAYLGIMGVQDGVDNTLRALNELINVRGRNDISLVLMGDGDQLHALQNLAHDLQLDEYVHFTGWIDKKDLLRYLAISDIGLSPDPYNVLNDHSTMLKTMEYMAMGVPVVAFNLRETRYSAQEAALYATPGNIEEFTHHIEYLLTHEEIRQQMGAYGRQRIIEHLSWQQNSQYLLQAYEALLKNSMAVPWSWIARITRQSRSQRNKPSQHTQTEQTNDIASATK